MAHCLPRLFYLNRNRLDVRAVDVGVARGGWPWAEAETSRHCLKNGV